MSESTEPTTTPAPAYEYRAPAVSIRATYTAGDVVDELVVEIDRGPIDLDTIRGVIDALTEKRDAAIDVATDGGTPPLTNLDGAAGNVRQFPYDRGGQLPAGATTYTPAGTTVTFNPSTVQGVQA